MSEPRFEAAMRTDRGTVREHNEDACISYPDVGLWAVADGMGGHAHGDVASRLVCEALARAATHDDGRPLPMRVPHALEAANRAILRHQVGRDLSGSTVVVLVAERSQGLCFWAGDSRLYRLRAGELVRLSHDHSVVQRLVDEGALSEPDALVHPWRNRITRAVGIGMPLELDRVEFRIEPDDTFLLCSDGLTGSVSEATIAALLGAPNVKSAAHGLIDEALALGADDNVTVVVVRCGGCGA